MEVLPDTPTCRIKGIIKKVSFEKQQIDKSPVGDVDPYLPGELKWIKYPARYKLIVLIQEVTYVSGSKDKETCKDKYEVDANNTFYVYHSDVRVGDEILKGKVISGEVTNGYFKSYELQ